MGEAGTVLVLVASLWASVNAIVAGYEAVNASRDRILLGEDDGRKLSLEHRELMFSFVGFFFLGASDGLFIRRTLAASRREMESPDGAAGNA